MTTIILERADFARSESGNGRGFRKDIQGLRAVAVTAVVLYHLNSPLLPGGFVGVDVFFVISGFLITGLLMKQLHLEGKVSLLNFYSRRAKRLLPAATLVLLSTAALTFYLLPPTRWGAIGWDTIASSLFSQNWRLALNSVDYLARDEAPSPFQHFWSLGVEEQFYFVWPLLLLPVGWLFTRGRRKKRGIVSGRLSTAILIALSLIALPSFLWSIYYTAEAPGPAYFASTTRAWELALGAALAASATTLRRLPTPVIVVLGWLGLIGIALSFCLIDTSMPFPGSVALIPALSTSAVIAAGLQNSRFGPQVILSVTPMQFLGNISYSLYLWHWPIIVIITAVSGNIGPLTGLITVAICLALAWVTYKWVERPLNDLNYFREMPFRAVQAGILLIVVTIMAGGALVNTDRDNQAYAESEAYNAGLPAPQLPQEGVVDQAVTPPVSQGAQVLPDQPRNADLKVTDVSDQILPDPVLAAKDWTTCGSARDEDSQVVSCLLGDKYSDNHVALVGDSHAQQWIPALDAIAAKNGWSLTAYIHDSCPFASGDLIRDGRSYESCISWNKSVLETLADDTSLSMVITSNFTNSAEIANASDNVAAMSQAFQRSWGEITMRKIPMVVIRDSPEPGLHIPDCVAKNTEKLTACAVPRSRAVDDRGLAQLAAATALSGVTAIDMNDYICPADMCAPVIGNVLVYRDSNHLTATYVQSLEDRLAPSLRNLIRIR